MSTQFSHQVVSALGLALEIDGSVPLTKELVEELADLCARAQDDAHDVLVLVVRGEPGEHSAHEGVGVHLVNKWERQLRQLERLEVATVAIADGACGGVAMEALLATDYRIATDDVTFRVPSISGEPWPGMVLHRLVTQTGIARIRRSALFGMSIPPQEALAYGLVDEFVRDASEAVKRTRRLMKERSGSELAIRRRLLLDSATTSFEDALGTHLAACDRSLRRSEKNTLAV